MTTTKVFLLVVPTAAAILAGPGSPTFSLVSAFAFGTVGGHFVSRLHLPSLVGQLLGGILVGQTGLSDGLPPSLSSDLRALALSVIMVRAGLGLDLAHLLPHRPHGSSDSSGWRLTLTLSVVPCLAEAVGAALVATYLLFGTDAMPLGWSLLLGFLLSDVSPAVTVPLLLDLQDGGYGRRKGLCTVLLAAAGLNGVVALVGFGVCLSLVRGGGTGGVGGGHSSSVSGADVVVLGAAEVVGGCIVGSALGGLVASRVCWDSPAAIATMAGHHARAHNVRAGLVLVAASAMILGGRALSMGGGGALGALCVGAVVAAARRPRSFHDGDQQSEIERQRLELQGTTRVLGRAWDHGGQVLLFALLGASVPNLQSITARDVRLGTAVVVAGLAVRFVATILSTRGSGWTRKERLFAALTWCPKATVQAALCTVALDFVEHSNYAHSGIDEEDDSEYGVQRRRAILLLNVAVLSILLTAPVFAVAIKLAGPHWLERDSDVEEGGGRGGCEVSELEPLQLEKKEEEGEEEEE